MKRKRVYNNHIRWRRSGSPTVEVHMNNETRNAADVMDESALKISAGKRCCAALARGAYWLWLALVSGGTLAIIIYALFLKTPLI